MNAAQLRLEMYTASLPVCTVLLRIYVYIRYAWIVIIMLQTYCKW